jgi:adenosylcobinamide-GDP ribazoletransferase
VVSPDAATASDAPAAAGSEQVNEAAAANPPPLPNSADHIPNMHLTDILRDLRVALGFFTRLPARAPDLPVAQAAAAFSLIGGLIGLAATLGYGLGLWIGLSSLMSAVLAVTATALLTGALHEDGLADFADMLGVRGDRQRKLTVMRDSTIGSYGTLALVLISLMKVAAISELAIPGQVAGALISAHALGRGVLPLIMRSYPMARRDGLAVHAGKPPANRVWISLALAMIIAAAVGGPGAALVSCFSALVVGFIIAQIASRQIGGYTGDVLGAAEQLVEVTVLMNFVSFT